jgi:limonene-1,2-epoxide hydrolase
LTTHDTQTEAVRDANAKLVKEFFAEWAKGDIVGTVENYLADDAVWKTSGAPDCIGKEACMERIKQFAPMIPEMHVEWLSFAADGDMVFGERRDLCKGIDGSDFLPVQCNGVMRIRDGKIVYWNDYFDPRPFLPEDGSFPPVR